MEIRDLKKIRDELERLTEGFRHQFEPSERLTLIARFQELLLDLNQNVDINKNESDLEVTAS
jgi:hypothetical protein